MHNSDKERKWFSRGDAALIAAIAVVSALLYFVFNSGSPVGKNIKAEILLEGKKVKTVALDEDMTFSLPQRENVVFEINDGKIRISSSDCPDKICVHTGYIDKPMQTAVCLPNAVSVRIVGEDEYDLDAVVG